MDSNGQLDRGAALALVSSNLNKVFGLYGEDHREEDLMVVEGGDVFRMESKVIGVVSPRSGHVHIF